MQMSLLGKRNLRKRKNARGRSTDKADGAANASAPLTPSARGQAARVHVTRVRSARGQAARASIARAIALALVCVLTLALFGAATGCAANVGGAFSPPAIAAAGNGINAVANAMADGDMALPAIATQSNVSESVSPTVSLSAPRYVSLSASQHVSISVSPYVSQTQALSPVPTTAPSSSPSSSMSPSPTATSTPFRRTPRPSGAIRSRDRGDGAAAAATAELTAAAAAETATTTTAVMEPVTSATPGAATEPATTTEPAATATPGATSVSGDSGKADPKKPMIALTFDDGPSKYTAKVLDALNKSGGRATFCMVGNRIGDNAKTAKLVAEQGSEVIGHSWDHKQLTKLSAAAIKAELVKTNDAIEAATGSRSKLYRPPYGSVNDSVKKISKELGLSMINWSVDTLDWKSRNADTVYKNIMADAKDGSIVLCHDLYESTLKAVERAIPALVAQGYQLVTVSELLRFSEKPAEPGKVYNKR